LEQMGNITRMRRGHLTEQYNRKIASDGKEQQWGPYYTCQAWVGGKNRSERVRREDVPVVQQDIRNYKRFTQLSDRYIETAETIAKANMDESKKKPKSFRRRSAGKSPNS